ncbi:MAG: hypothetical protein R2771_15205 [Saprospiraceae bacterium]
MKKFLFFSLFLLISIETIFAQNKQDYIFLSGYVHGNDYSNTWGNKMDFNSGGKIDSVGLGDVIAYENSLICDKKGNLLFYFGGCSIVDSTNHIMENGDSINFGTAWIRFCKNGYRNYPGNQNSIVLPDPGNVNKYYLIHKTGETLTDPKFNSFCELKYSYLDMTEGNGKVIVKNRDILPGKNFVASYVTACKHKNGNDWWIIQAENDTSLFYTFLLTNDTIILANIQILIFILMSVTSVGQAVFSPDGSKWVMYGDINSYNPGQGGCLVFDFDRASGELSNMQLIEIIIVPVQMVSQYLQILNFFIFLMVMICIKQILQLMILTVR